MDGEPHAMLSSCCCCCFGSKSASGGGGLMVVVNGRGVGEVFPSDFHGSRGFTSLVFSCVPSFYRNANANVAFFRQSVGR